MYRSSLEAPQSRLWEGASGLPTVAPHSRRKSLSALPLSPRSFFTVHPENFPRWRLQPSPHAFRKIK